MRSHKDLLVYQKAKELTQELFELLKSQKVPTNYNFWVNQVMRSTSSIGANIAEGYGRYSKANLAQFYLIARGSSFETDYWFELMLESKIFNQNKILNLVNKNIEITKMLTSLVKNLKS